MNKTELIEQVGEKSGLTKAQSAEAVNAVFSSIIEASGKKEPVQIIRFGTFKVRHRKERMSRHPKTGEKIKTPAREVAVFSAGKRLKDSVHLQSPKETQVAKKSKSAAKKSLFSHQNRALESSRTARLRCLISCIFLVHSVLACNLLVLQYR